MKKLISITILAITVWGCKSGHDSSISSPNGKIRVEVSSAQSGPALDIYYADSLIAKGVKVGIDASYIDPSEPISVLNSNKAVAITDDYVMPVGKRSHCTNHANEKSYTLGNGSGSYTMTLRAYDDGVAIRYTLQSPDSTYLLADDTSFPVPDSTRRWAQSYDVSYEGFYPLATDGMSSSKRNPQMWGYPMLVEPRDSVFMLLTEADVRRGSCASYLNNAEDLNMYRVTLADDSLAVDGSYSSPWRVAIIGSLADVVESTLVTDLSAASVAPDAEWAAPAPVSWVYWANNHGSNDYNIIKQYTDLAVDMQWPYVLIDAEWDEMKDGYTIEDAVRYAVERGVKPMIWYNSSTGWIDGAPGPKFRLNDRADRLREFAWLDSIGVVGVKIDFFAGDRAETMDYYIDLIEDALDSKLMVTLHGATIPRGWQRTYPNMMTMEGVYGAEWYNNTPVLTDRAAAHNATLPFTRNVIGPMDYTPGTFSDSQHPHITTHAHELALCYLFESALQHMPDRPESYASLPSEVKSLLMTLPTAWDDTRLLGGYPGDWVALARRSGDTWYIAAINGSDDERVIEIDPSLAGITGSTMTLVSDGPTQTEFAPVVTSAYDGSPISVTCAPRGGFLSIIK